MLKFTSPLLFFILLTLFSCTVIKKSQHPFEAKLFTPINSFTSGAEGPAVDKEGNLYAVNFLKEGTIGKVTVKGIGSVFLELPNKSIGHGIRFNSKGEMFVADYINHNILKIKMSEKQLSVYANEPSMSQPNDIAIDSKDRLYASDPNWAAGTGTIWRIDTNGKVTALEKNMGTTNGIEVSPDEKILYVNESVQRKVWAYDLSETGLISHKRLLIEFPDFGLDGMRCDAAGNLFIARHGKGTIVEISSTGKIVREIILSGKSPSNLAFGGVDGRTIFVTLQDTRNIESFAVDIPGREWVMKQSK